MVETDAVKGLVIFTGTVALYVFVLLGCLERRLKNVSRVIKKVEDDVKYVN